MPIEVPERIDVFKIERPLHEGGMGVLYLARDTRRGARVVLKVSRPVKAARGGRGDTERTAAEQAFYEEALQGEVEILRELHHPHIVRLYPLEEGPRAVYSKRIPETGQWYFAMELLEGGSLEELLKRRSPLPIEVAVEIGYQVAMALEYLHARGIAHRDIKPNNILFRRPVQEGIEAVLVDFGLAQRQRARGLEAGTLLYMAPEQIEQEKGGTARPDPRPADIYALGVVLYRMVTGRLPFEGRSREQLTSAIRKSMPTRPSLLRRETPAPLDDLIFEMLAKDPERRPTASLVARRLNEAVPWHRRFLEEDGKPERTSPPPPAPTGRSLGRNLLMFFLLALAATGWGLYLSTGRGVPTTEATPTPVVRITPTPIVLHQGGSMPSPTPTTRVEPTSTPVPTRTPTPTPMPPPSSPTPTS
ncbi:serine/threonine-protein kinase [Thermoflexus sp.]|jgi:serine/threonine protein kinase|uniref:serine/threonine-protein kinase n=1 Tax=Thermoflexus sp. TaxID=1969742 RepID=UPI002635510E|nr:serine/threonine-protein kinase [Thermoflexus sp.]